MVSVPLNLAAGSDPLGHVLDQYTWGTSYADAVIAPGLVFAVTMNLISLFIAAALTIWILSRVASAITTGPESAGAERYVTRGRVAQIIEVMVLHLRDTVIRPQLGHEANRFLPLLLTVFFFILISNIFGLLPLMDIQHAFGIEHPYIGGTPTGRLAVTAALATVVFFIWHIHGIRDGGVGGWLMHFTGGAPWFLWPIMVIVEIMGMFVKPAALTLRLFANMTAGHILLAVLLGFVAAAPRALGIWGAPISVVAFGGSVAIFFLELFVALLQAFIFMFLTTLFIAQMAHHDHEEEDERHLAEKYDFTHPAIEDVTAPVTG